MKYPAILLNLVIALSFLGCQNSIADKKQSVNPILGDISFINKFGHKPDAFTNNELRVKTHLAFVENLLRNKEVSHLSPVLKANRRKALDLLHTYWTKGIFPRNYDYKNERRPCFIDKDGTICAVGFLVEQTCGRKVAEEINGRHKYEALLAMNEPLIEHWIETSGLTKEECAMIQPTYGSTPGYSYNHISKGYGISSAVATGVNLSLDAINISQLRKNTHSKTAPVLGLICGAGQIVLCATQYPNDSDNWYFTYTNESKKRLSMLNLGVGTATVVLSAWNLITHRKAREKSTTWNIYSFPTPANNAGIGFSLTRKL